MPGEAHRRSYDVVVVGARVAGAVTAALMAREGLSVLVVDRARFPSPTLSTHYFRGEHLVRVIDRVGALQDALGSHSPQLVHEYAYAPGLDGAQRRPAEGAGSLGYCLSMRRVLLDQILLDHARNAGAEVITECRVRGIVMERDRAVGVVLDDGGTIAAGLVVGADGVRSLVAASVRATDQFHHRGMRALYFRYVSGMAAATGSVADGAEFSLLGDQLGYVFPSDSNLTCVALSVNLDDYDRIRHDANTGFDMLLSRHVGVWDRYASAVSRSRVYGWGVHDDFVRNAAGPGWALVGDAGLHQDPWTGRGMDCAGLSAELLAASLIASGDPADPRWADHYQQERDDALLRWFDETVTGGRDLSALVE